ncbi:MAG: arginase family protein [Cyanobacteria bacterium J06560_2]
MNALDSTLNLFFPQWQGCGNLGLYRGATLLRQVLDPAKSFAEIPVSSAYSLAVTQNILGLSQISTQLQAACSCIQHKNPARIFTIGGDCGVEIAPVSFLNQKYGRSLAVIWLDAHGDLNTPSSSPSGHFHGMPLRALLGEGPSTILSQSFSQLCPEQVFLVGVRALDLLESRFIRQSNLLLFSVEKVNANRSAELIRSIKAVGFNKVYVHLDLDVLDPQVFPYTACPTPKGINLESLSVLLTDLKCNFEIVGASVLEFLLSGDVDFSDASDKMKERLSFITESCLREIYFGE